MHAPPLVVAMAALGSKPPQRDCGVERREPRDRLCAASVGIIGAHRSRERAADLVGLAPPIVPIRVLFAVRRCKCESAREMHSPGKARDVRRLGPLQSPARKRNGMPYSSEKRLCGKSGGKQHDGGWVGAAENIWQGRESDLQPVVPLRRARALAELVSEQKKAL